MTILFADGFEGVDPGWTVRTGVLGSGRAGAGWHVGAADSLQKTIAAAASVRVNQWVRNPTGATSDGTYHLVDFYEGATEHLAIEVSATGEILATLGGVTLATSAAGVLPGGTDFDDWRHVRVEATIDDVTGQVEVWAGGTSVLSFTGDTRNGGTTGLVDSVRFGGPSASVYHRDLISITDLAEPAPDLTAPTVAATFPATGAGGVSVGVEPHIDWSADMATESWANGKVALYNVTDSLDVAYTPAYDAVTHRLTLSPDVPLGHNKSYEIRVIGPAGDTGFGIPVDVNGNAIAVPVTAAFSTGIVGDAFADAIEVAGSGAQTVTLTGATREAEEPTDEGVTDGTVWLHLDSAATSSPGELTASATAGVLEVLTGSSLDDLVVLGEGPYVGAISGNLYLRVTAASGTSDVTWAYAARTPGVVVTAEDMQQAPGSVRVTISNGLPGTRVTVSIDGQVGTSKAIDLDSAGQVLNYSVSVDVELAAGTYTLRVVHPGRDDSTTTFDVLNEPDIAPVSLPPAEPASTVPGSVVLVNGHYVRRFVLQDKLAGGLGDYVLPINPRSMTSPFPDNPLQAEPTLAPDGQIMTWEGARRTKSWTWSGYLEEQAQLDAMLGFQKLNRRIYVIDHRNRAWIVSFDRFDPTPVRNPDKPWAHSYEAVFTIFDGPTEPGA